MNSAGRTAIYVACIIIAAITIIGVFVIMPRPWPQEEDKTDLDRRLAVDELNNYSDFSGWEAKFSFEWKTLRMDGSMLCAKDFLELIPPNARKLVDQNFDWFRCVNGNTKVVLHLHE